MNRKSNIDDSTKGARPTVAEQAKALAIYEGLARPKKPPTGQVRK